ncbi:MAG: hypothetical protein SOW29_02900 [Candidatus Faecousia sp.]|nr:hypothetical protein [Candidatus Faecousia sp.]
MVEIIQHTGEFPGVTLGIGGGHELSGLLLHGVPVQDEVLVPALLDLHQLLQVVHLLLEPFVLIFQVAKHGILVRAGGIADILLTCIKPLTKRNNIPIIVIGHNIGNLHLVCFSDYIAQSSAYWLPVHHVAAFIQDDTVIRQIILVYVIRNVVSVRPVWKPIFLKLTHTIFHARLFKQLTNFRNPCIKWILHLHIGCIQGFFLSSFRVTLGVFFVFSEILPVAEHGKTASFF